MHRTTLAENGNDRVPRPRVARSVFHARLLAFAILVPALASAQMPGSVRGVVRTESTGAALSGALVEADGPGGVTRAITDARASTG
jgi:hypothetical protein